MAKVLISYRRGESIDVTGRIYDRLVGWYGKGNVFNDEEYPVLWKPVEAEFARRTSSSDKTLARKAAFAQQSLRENRDPVELQPTFVRVEN